MWPIVRFYLFSRPGVFESLIEADEKRVREIRPKPFNGFNLDNLNDPDFLKGENEWFEEQKCTY